MPFLIMLLKGVGAGLLISVPTGPVGFLCVRRTSLYGRIAGLVSGLGSVSADIIYALVVLGVLHGVGEFLLKYQPFVRCAGALFLLSIGYSLICQKREEAKEYVYHKNLWSAYFSTFFITATNPVQMITFAALFGTFGMGLHHTHWIGVFILGLSIGAFMWWVGLTLFIEKFSHTISMGVADKISFVVGVVVFAMGAGVLASVVMHALHFY